MNNSERMIELVRTDKPAFIPRRKIQQLFKGKRNEGHYYSHLLFLYASYYPNRLENDSFFYENEKAMKDLDLSRRQVTSIRNYLKKEKWIFINQRSIRGVTKWWIQINQTKFFQEIEKLEKVTMQTPNENLFRVVV